MRAPHLSVVAPCFNEEAVLPTFYQRMDAVCRTLGCDYEIVLINDGSRDSTWKQMSELALHDTRLVAIDLRRNHGHQLALTAGLSVCRGERILVIDADLQDPPELLPAMMTLLDQGADVVYGQRRKRAGETWFKKLTANLFYRLIARLSDVPIPRDTGDFRLMNRATLDLFLRMPERHRFIRGIISWLGGRQVPLLYDRESRAAGETKYPLRKMIRFAVDAITSFSIVPLRVASYVGIFSAVLGLFLCLFAVVSWAAGGTVTGWSSLMAVISLLGGTQLVVLGVIGEYLGRLYEQSKNRPIFMIREVLNGPEKTPGFLPSSSPVSSAA